MAPDPSYLNISEPTFKNIQIVFAAPHCVVPVGAVSERSLTDTTTTATRQTTTWCRPRTNWLKQPTLTPSRSRRVPSSPSKPSSLGPTSSKWRVLLVHQRACPLSTLKPHGPFVAFNFYCKIMLIGISYNYCSVLTANKGFNDIELISFWVFSHAYNGFENASWSMCIQSKRPYCVSFQPLNGTLKHLLRVCTR